MKQKPQKLPSRYLLRFNDRIGEWQVRKKFIYIDEKGNRKDTATKWCLSIEDAERIARERINNAFAIYDQKVTKKTSFKSLFKDYVDELETLYKEDVDFKITTRKDNFERARSLYDRYLPGEIGKIEVKNLQPSDFTRWLRIINKTSLSGRRVRAFRTSIKAFSEFLVENGYISTDFQILVSHGLSTTKLKAETVGSRSDRNEIDFSGVQKIIAYYESLGLGKFDNFYWYVLWLILFCTGMRVGELVALQWKHVQFSDDPASNIIYIRNSVAQKQTRQNVQNILDSKHESPKNNRSRRNITMWAVYRSHFKKYRESYMYHHKIDSLESLNDYYVFPNITSLNDKLGYQTQKNLLRELNRVCKKDSVNIAVPDCQMFRHGCAKFLAYDCGFSIEETKHYFGHTDSDMIENVYAPLEAEERRRQVSRTQTSLISDEEIIFNVSKSSDALKITASDDLEIELLLKDKERIYQQILVAIGKGQSTYYYSSEDYPAIVTIQLEHPELEEQINFTERG